jgi:Htaa protein/Big-like domain-containing protein
MSSSRRLRLVAGAGITAVAAASLAVVAAPGAQAAGTSPASLTWLFSEYVHRAPAAGGQFAAPVVSDGATVDPSTGRVTFADGSGRTDTGTHATTVSYGGSAAFSDSHGGASYTVTFSDPELTIDASGNGSISADIAWVAAGETPGSATDVELTSFTAAETAWSSPFALKATPDWTSEVPADTYGTGKPVNGASWGQDFVTAIPASIRAFFYASGSGSDAAKAPSPFDAVVPGPAVTVTGSSMTAQDVSLNVAGTGFTGVTKPGDAGVYAGLAPAGGLPDVSTMAGMDAFAASAYVPAAAISNGAFASVLHADESALVAGTQYAIYTWQAHTHSNTSQDTETPVTIDWAALGATTVLPVVTAPAVTYGKATTVSVSVPGASGTVTLTGLGAARTAELVSGSATFAVPAGLQAGSHPWTVSYGGDVTHFPSQRTGSLSVAKVTTKTTVKVAPKPTAKKAGKVTVTLTGVAGSKVKVVVKKAGKVVKKATVKVNAKGRVVVRLPKAAKGGTFKVTATYAGDANHKASSGKATYKVAKPRKR